MRLRADRRQSGTYDPEGMITENVSSRTVISARKTFTEVMMEVGADCILYSIDYPFEDVVIAAEWLDHTAISDADRSKIGRSNAGNCSEFSLPVSIVATQESLLRTSRRQLGNYRQTGFAEMLAQATSSAARAEAGIADCAAVCAIMPNFAPSRNRIRAKGK